MCNACVPKSHPVPCLYVFFFFRMMICWSPVSWIFFNISTTKISSESPISHDLASGAMCGATSFKTITQLSSDSSKVCTFCHRVIVMQVVKKKCHLVVAKGNKEVITAHRRKTSKCLTRWVHLLSIVLCCELYCT